MDKPKPEFTIDDLLAELQPDDIPDGMTTREVCERRGWPATKANMARAYNRIRDLIELGLWEYAGKKKTVAITGADRFSPAYRPRRGGDANENSTC